MRIEKYITPRGKNGNLSRNEKLVAIVLISSNGSKTEFQIDFTVDTREWWSHGIKQASEETDYAEHERDHGCID